MEDEKPHWTVDRRIPVALILTLVVQFGAGVWWMSELSSRVTNLEKFEASVSSTRPINQNRITVLEQKFDFIQQTLARIERKLEKESP